MSLFTEGFFPHPFEQAPDSFGGQSVEKNCGLPTILLPRDFIQANQQPEVKDNLKLFDENRTNENITLEWDCIDARKVQLLPWETIYFNTIANGGDPAKLEAATNSPVVKQILVVSHNLCGGRIAKSQQVSQGIHTPDLHSLSGYVSREIDHPSIIQSGVQAKKLSRLTSKQVAAMVRNHEDGTLRVLAVFNRTDGGISSNMSDEIFDQPAPVNPEHDNEIPYMKFNSLPEDIQEFLIRHEQERQAFFAAHPQGVPKMIEHNPRIAQIATNLRASNLWIPEIALPGEIVRLTVPRHKIPKVNGEKTTVLNPKELQLVWQQIEYAIGNAIQGRDVQNAPFRDTNTIFIATPRYELSEEIAMMLAEHPFTHPWLTNEQNKVILAEDRSGILQKVAEIKFKIDDGEVISCEERDAVFA